MNLRLNLTKPQRDCILDDVEHALGERKIWLTVPEVASIIAAHKHTIGQMCATGTLPARQSCKGAPYFVHYTQLARFEEAAA